MTRLPQAYRCADGYLYECADQIYRHRGGYRGIMKFRRTKINGGAYRTRAFWRILNQKHHQPYEKEYYAINFFK